ncbi:CheR family methyltransferase [Stigmatella aurantiaca]|uniref:Chemotaxis methyltransferase CheR n=1 Tax=Stigmatella aurantiaca (strain DW4/3-1) TaxID=378806 RepID=Q08NE7_STIAD|nr:CheR family methyltransferase [Stigmatella aurantiaca]ADO73675.1 Chemotaxis protein methyltransferase CheR [Stigmatella aurantiaca DW4/3-1]EAU62008.1 chemotaxis methyltransferase CheR [Stigmatella aurantiaca DW4/3-1]
MQGPSSQPASLLHAFISARSGMALSGTQRRRLDERLALLQGSLTEQQYLLHLQSPSGAGDLASLISVIAVHKTDLFRDEVQLASFRTHVLEPLVARSSGRPLRVWSAGCATGEEVATLLILLDEAGADPTSSVLGTDISEQALLRARTLTFHPEQVRRLPASVRDRYFLSEGARSFLAPELRGRALFQLHNLMEAPYPAHGEGFDIIFCRNVLIYFTTEAFDRVVEALAERLAPGGTLVLSAAEPLLHAPPSLRIIRCEHAFFYVRTFDIHLAPPKRLPASGNLLAEPPTPRPERRRDSGVFHTVTASGQGNDWSREAAPSAASPADSRRDSGRFAAMPSGPARDSGRFAAMPAVPARDSGRFATVATVALRDSGRFPAVGGGLEPAGGLSSLELMHAEADALFAQILEGAGETDVQKEEYLRRCLSLDPELAAARYLLGMMLELREEFPEAAGEYRRALRSLEEGKARATPFFLNPARLQVACARAVERMEVGKSR